ncbi:hypothetical protein H2203_002833 [Taxawa tesnikishii (nom. ined.)]|nr:hypothetical protein H2203_002833 [Dothideales sp. JES 119]
MSRFVSGGTIDQPFERDEAWLKAQEEVEVKRRQREEEGRQEGAKSLYETLQANKAAKQEAFEESIRLKNQFRSLDDDEVEFLDSVLESTRAKENAVKKETAEQLGLFRKQQEEVEAAARAAEGDNKPETGETWALRKTSSVPEATKAEKSVEAQPSVASLATKDAKEAPTTTTATFGIIEVGAETHTLASTAPFVENTKTTETPLTKSPTPPVASLGLAGYSSDED